MIVAAAVAAADADTTAADLAARARDAMTGVDAAIAEAQLTDRAHDALALTGALAHPADLSLVARDVAACGLDAVPAVAVALEARRTDELVAQLAVRHAAAGVADLELGAGGAVVDVAVAVVVDLVADLGRGGVHAGVGVVAIVAPRKPVVLVAVTVSVGRHDEEGHFARSNLHVVRDRHRHPPPTVHR
jgi:hypothetical protein